MLARHGPDTDPIINIPYPIERFASFYLNLGVPLTYLCQVDSSNLTLWTSLFPIEEVIDCFCYYHALYKFLYLMQAV